MVTSISFTFLQSLAGALLLGSVLLSVAFLIYGLNTLHLTLRSKKYRQTMPGSLSERPTVAIHLPIYNEVYVVGRLLASCMRAAEFYGRDLVKIYVLDDSTDETGNEIDRVTTRYRSEGFNITLIRRGNRRGFKAGALQAGFKLTEEKYIAVFDADFVLPPDFLNRTVPILENQPDVGFVQARWGHLDRGHSLITQSVAIGVDAHFLLEQQGRNGSGYLMNFNGSAGVIRTTAIAQVGGWASDTLAEDLDLSYRLQLQGYRGVYLGDLEVPAELPPTITSLKRQQGRWARGSLQAAKKLLGRIRRSNRLSVAQKFEASIHLTYYLVHPLMVASFLLAVAADFLSINVVRYGVSFTLPGPTLNGTLNVGILSFVLIPWLVFSSLVAISTFAVLLYCVQAVRLQKLSLPENVKQIMMLVIIGYGISISNSVQAMGGILSRNAGTFSRTPKYAIEGSGQSWKGKKYQIPLSKTSALEAAGVALAIAATIRAVLTSNWGLIPILLVYMVGYSFVLALTIKQAVTSGGSSDE